MLFGSWQRMNRPLLTFSSDQNSKWIWKSLYFSLVTRWLVPLSALSLSATSSPFSTRQLALGPTLSRAAGTVLPSNSWVQPSPDCAEAGEFANSPISNADAIVAQYFMTFLPVGLLIAQTIANRTGRWNGPLQGQG